MICLASFLSRGLTCIDRSPPRKGPWIHLYTFCVCVWVFFACCLSKCEGHTPGGVALAPDVVTARVRRTRSPPEPQVNPAATAHLDTHTNTKHMSERVAQNEGGTEMVPIAIAHLNSAKSGKVGWWQSLAMSNQSVVAGCLSNKVCACSSIIYFKRQFYLQLRELQREFLV